MKRKQGASWVGVAKKIAIGVAVSLGIMLVVCAIGAAMIAGGSMEETSMGYVSTVALLLAAVFGAWVTSAGQDSNRLMLCAIHGAAWFLTLLCMGILLFDTAAQGVGSTAMLSIGGSCAAGLVTMKKKGNRVPGKRRYKIHAFVQNAQ